MRQPKGGSKITLAYIILAPPGAACWMVYGLHYRVNLVALIIVAYLAELALAGAFSIGRRR